MKLELLHRQSICCCCFFCQIKINENLSRNFSTVHRARWSPPDRPVVVEVQRMQNMMLAHAKFRLKAIFRTLFQCRFSCISMKGQWHTNDNRFLHVQFDFVMVTKKNEYIDTMMSSVSESEVYICNSMTRRNEIKKNGLNRRIQTINRNWKRREDFHWKLTFSSSCQIETCLCR